MLVRETISNHIKPLGATDTVRDALSAMKESGQSLLPVVDQTTNRFIGMVSRESAGKHEDAIDSVLAIREAQHFVSTQNQNIFDAARLMDKHKLTLLPVLDSERNYLGVVDRSTLNERIVQVMNFTEYGSIITIHFEERDFTLSQLIRIIEAEGGLILGLGVESPHDSNPFYVVTIKLNLPDPGRIVAALKRHEYIVDAQSTDNQEDRKYEERADELMHYLNI